MQPLYDLMAEADGMIFATPVFFYGMTAQMKAVIDRTYAPPGPDKSLANKVGAVIVVAGSVGVIDVVKDLYFYFAVKRMLHGNWVGAYATVKGDIENRQAALQSSLDLGREMVQIANLGFRHPSGFRRNHFAYGTHTH
jgi:multimeric flavodoxin WrbA